MAPELLRSSRNRSYNEKVSNCYQRVCVSPITSSHTQQVDIFSFGVLLHFVVTGSKPMPFLLQQQSSFLHSMNLSKAIATALDEHRPRAVRENAASAILEDGQHPAARGNKVTLCVAACMQPLLQDCLSPVPRDRPSAGGISHRLLLCTGPLPQDKMVLHGHTHISRAHLSREAGCIVAQLNNSRELTTLTLGSWAPKTSFLPLMEQETPLITVTGRLLVVATRMEQTLSVYRLPELSEAEELPARLPFPPSCIFSYQDSANNSMVVVGAEGGHLTVFCASEQLTLELLRSEQIFYNQDSRKSAITAGVYHQEALLCGCGRYLIGVHTENLEQKYIRMLSKRQTDRVTDVVASKGKVWTMIATSSEVVVCSASSGNILTTIDCK